MDPASWNIAAEDMRLDVGGLITPFGLKLSRLSLNAGDVKWFGEEKRLVVERPGEFQATVDEADLEAFIKAKSPEGVDIESVKVLDGVIRVQASVQMIITIGGSADCVLEIEEGKRLIVKAVSVDVLGASMKGMVQKQLDALNPVVDAADLPLTVIFESPVIRPGQIVISGTVAPSPS